MTEWKRLFYYLLLNVVVSAVTTFAVLLFWEKVHIPEIRLEEVFALRKESPLPTLNLPTLQSQKTKQPAAQGSVQQADTPSITVEPAIASPSSASLVMLEAVIGAGDLATEKVRIKRGGGDVDLALANWRMQGKGDLVYIFPQLTLHKGGAVDVYTTSGVDTVIALFWGRKQAAWQSGSKVTLLDAEGREQAVYLVP